MLVNALGRLLAAPLMFSGFLCGLPAPTAHAARDDSFGVSADGLGNLYISGYTDGSLDGPFAGGFSDAFVSKYDAAGNLLWTRQLGTATYDRSNGVSADGLGNIFISGSTDGGLGGPYLDNQDAFVAKYDAAGNLQWTRQLGTAQGDSSYGISADGFGNAYVSGQTLGSLAGSNAGGYDVFVGKYDAAGNLLWTRQLGTVGTDRSNGVSADGLGNVYISGYTYGSLGGPNAGGADAFVSKYDAAGNLQWTRQLGTAQGDSSSGISADGLGNVYISGSTGGSLGGSIAGYSDAFLSKYDAAGNLQWTRQLGSGTTDRTHGVSADGLGNAYISGHTYGDFGGPNAGYEDAFLSKYDAAGNLQWTRQFGADGFDSGQGVSADGLGNAYVTGHVQSYDAFVASYDAGGDLQWTRILRDNVIPEPASWLLAALGAAAVLRSRGSIYSS